MNTGMRQRKKKFEFIVGGILVILDYEFDWKVEIF